MSRYKCDPRWITIKFEGNAAFVAGVPIHPGPRLLLPEDRSLYCEAEDCGKAASREFSARAFEEDNTSM